ncbi:hypothetical protein BD779DRAFT_1002245 [Infundibulicybe gibba]|nr:hypothetical protein BD779DRAFT_1002245 [Infundibulicybe gibba]
MDRARAPTVTAIGLPSLEPSCARLVESITSGSRPTLQGGSYGMMPLQLRVVREKGDHQDIHESQPIMYCFMNKHQAEVTLTGSGSRSCRDDVILTQAKRRPTQTPTVVQLTPILGITRPSTGSEHFSASPVVGMDWTYPTFEPILLSLTGICKSLISHFNSIRCDTKAPKKIRSYLRML